MSTLKRTPIALVATLILASAAPGTIGAQGTPAPQEALQTEAGRWDFLASSGSLIPTGDLKSDIDRGGISTVQLSYRVAPHLALTTTVGWARSRDIAVADSPRLDVFTWDVGAEVRGSTWTAGDRLRFTPLLGAGAGTRSYNYRKLEVDAAHNLAGYASAGGELGLGWVHLRVEVRKYLAGFRPLDGNGISVTRSDLVTLFGLRFGRGF